jgi:hypothetical protein
MRIRPSTCHLLLAAGALLVRPASGTLPQVTGRRQYADLSTASDVNGATECPCISSFPPTQAAVPALLAAKGFPATYGLQGCQAYDAGVYAQIHAQRARMCPPLRAGCLTADLAFAQRSSVPLQKLLPGATARLTSRDIALHRGVIST